VLVFTTHGDQVAHLVRELEHLNLSPGQRDAILRDFDEAGFGFVPSFAPEINFGESLSSPGWVRERVAAAGLNVLSLLESGWLGQDAVIASR
jgi:hypothetical protein